MINIFYSTLLSSFCIGYWKLQQNSNSNQDKCYLTCIRTHIKLTNLFPSIMTVANTCYAMLSVSNHTALGNKPMSIQQCYSEKGKTHNIAMINFSYYAKPWNAWHSEPKALLVRIKNYYLYLLLCLCFCFPITLTH